MARAFAPSGIVFLKSCLLAAGLLVGAVPDRAGAQSAAPVLPPVPAGDPAAAFAGPALVHPGQPVVPCPPVDPCLTPAIAGDGLFADGARPRTFEGLPDTLLWEPLIASKREPRFSALWNSHGDYLGDEIIDTWLGGTYGVLRYSPAGRAYEIQLDFFGVVISRWSEANYLIAADYRAGVPVTFRSGNWSGKVAYEHTSTHIGDETIERLNVRRIEYKREELVTALGYVFDDRVRVYGQVAWAFAQEIAGDPSRFRYDVGCELFDRRGSGPWGQPFGAFNVELDGDVEYHPSVTVQAGWMWRKPDQRLGQVRAFVEYYTGRSFYGQLFRNKENAWSVGVSLDY